MTHLGILDENDPRNPLFFLSYAHSREARRPRGAPREPNRRFIKFFEDLSESVAQLISRATGSDPGFIDRSILDGERWNEDLLHAIGTCQVFVALLSPPYFASKWCSMEWHAFSHRKVVSRADGSSSNQTAIIPVVWAPFHQPSIPLPVSALQRFSPRGLPDLDITAQYEQEGVFGLLQMQLDVAYQAVIWRLAQRIADLHYTHYVEPREFGVNELQDGLWEWEM